MKPLTMPDNGWTEEEKEIVCRVLWGQPEDIAAVSAHEQHAVDWLLRDLDGV